MNFIANASPSSIDERDYYFKPIIRSAFPPELDLIPDVFAVEDQLSQGSCVANGVVSMCEIMLKRAGKGRHLSREFLYHEALKLEGRLGQEGLNSRDAFKVGRRLGIPDEAIYPYDISKRDVDPPQEVYDAAKAQVLDRFENLGFPQWGAVEQKLATIKGALCEGLPVGFVMPVTDSYSRLQGDWHQQSYRPYGSGDTVLGYHFQVYVAWDDAVQKLCALNSWNKIFGDGGFAGIPFVDLGSVVEAWVILGFDGCDQFREPGIYCTRNDSTGISAQIVPTEAEQGKTTNIWLAGKLDGAWAVKDLVGEWKPYTGGEIPCAWPNAVLDGAVDIDIQDGDLSSLKGAEAYVAYGNSPLDWKFSRICTL